MDNAMFCYQCEQTMGGKGCTKSGVCGKTPEIANLQDLLVYQLKGMWSLSQCIIMCLPIIITERALKKNFDENGDPKN